MPESVSKPIDRWLVLLGLAMGAIFVLSPQKSPFFTGLLLVSIFALLIHPLWNFWWIDKSLLRRLAASIALVVLLVLFGVMVWPEQNEKVTPAAQNKSETKPREPPNLHKLFEKEFPGLLKVGTTRTMTFKNLPNKPSVAVDEKAYLDFDAKSKFLAYYIPYSPLALKICEYLPELHKTTLREFDDKYLVTGGHMAEFHMTSSKDLVFSGRIYIYHENNFSLQELAALERLFESKELSVVFRGAGYLISVWDSVNK